MDPRIKAAIMFGRGKFQNGVLIEPKAEYSVDPENIDQVEAFKTAIWCVDISRSLEVQVLI